MIGLDSKIISVLRQTGLSRLPGNREIGAPLAAAHSHQVKVWRADSIGD
jgi:hypothetical protein